MVRVSSLSAMLVIIFAGCTPRPDPPALRTAEPLGLVAVRTEAQLKKYPFRILQQFEHPVDLAFVIVDGPPVQLSPDFAHTGQSSALLEKKTGTASIKLPSLLSSVKWPGQWTLVGAYFYAEKPQTMRAIYEIEGKSILNYAVQIPAKQWTPLLLDIFGDGGAKCREGGLPAFCVPDGLRQPVWCDDVVIMN